MGYCNGCFEKQLEIDRLKERIEHLDNKLDYRKRKEKEGYFGSSTPSSKQPFKENSSVENPHKNGGAKPGHPGNGRKAIREDDADEIEYLNAPDTCPFCGEELEKNGVRNRSIIDTESNKAKKKVVTCEKKRCPRCNKTIQAKPAALPKSLYGNTLVSQACLLHFVHGVPVGRIEEMWGDLVTNGVLFKIFQRVARYWEPAFDKLIEEYRHSSVLHADETGWRTDGQSGYAWIFCTTEISLFQFKTTRSSEIPKKVFGPEKLKGTLVVDRYGGYNKAPLKIQYCYAHLLRAVEDIGKEFEKNEEVQAFVAVFAPLLADAMHLYSKECSDAYYYKEAKEIKQKILEVVAAEAHHMGIRNIQDIFHENEKRLYHWASDRRVPADNNRAERDLRSTVIARKVSFGSQSAAGAKARSILMTILHTARKRLPSGTIEEWFKNSLDQIAQNPSIETYSLIPKPTIDSS